MRKILSVLLVALLALPMSAQVSRKGNTYFADGQTMKKKAFAAYMQDKAEANLAAQFQSGLTVANAGWGLFGAGLGLEMAGFICTGASGVSGMKADEKGATGGQVAGTVTGLAAGGLAMILIGSGSVTASIVCLGVGYARMHQSADAYIVNQKQKPQAYISVKADGNGLGLALNF